MRPISACTNCRERRKRCFRTRHGTSCNYCIDKGLVCSVGPVTVPDISPGYAPLFDSNIISRTRVSSAAIPDPELSEELVDLYFVHVNASLPSLFHRPTLKSSVQDGTVSKALFLAIISLSARFSSHPGFADIEPCERGRPYAKEAERLLNLREKSLTTIQTCILLGTVFQVEGDPDTESVYYAIASRVALLLDLPNANASSPLEQELNRRVWWSIITIETWHSAALCIPRTLNPSEAVPMPMDEREFAKSQPQFYSSDVSIGLRSSEMPDPPASLLGYMVRLNRLLDDVNKLNASLVSGSITDGTIHELVKQLSASLDLWKDSLPSEYHYNAGNVTYWADKNLGQAFLNLHILYNNVGQRLFYQFLYCIQDTTGTLHMSQNNNFAEKCKFHATNICQIIHQAMEKTETELLSSLLGHILVISSTVQLHTLLFSGDDGEIAASKFRLEQNFEVLMRLNSYWPNVSTAMNRFNDFHRACLRSRDNSFRLDRWMLQFMLQFSRPLKDRNEIAERGDLWVAEILRYLRCS